jgi:hypothetical protein
MTIHVHSIHDHELSFFFQLTASGKLLALSLMSCFTNNNMQVLESSNYQEHADKNVERHGIDASQEAMGDGNVVCLNAPCASHGSGQAVIH